MNHSIKLTNLLTWAFTAIALMLSTVSTSYAGDRDIIMDEITGNQLVRLLRSEGIDNAEVDEDGDVLVYIDDIPMYFLITPNNENILYKYGASTRGVTYDDVNDWNVGKRYSRAYIDHEGDPILELDLDLAGGVTVARVKDFIRTCETSLMKFRDEVVRGRFR